MSLLSPRPRALLVFHLAQLSYCHLAIRLAGLVHPAGDPDIDHYAYEVARVHARTPGKTAAAIRRDQSRTVISTVTSLPAERPWGLRTAFLSGSR